MFKRDNGVNKIVFYFVTFLVFLASIICLVVAINSNDVVKGRENEIDSKNGKSAYEVAKENGFTGTLDEYLESIKGESGKSGLSPYDLAVLEGFEGDAETWVSLINGIKGVDGTDGKTSYEIACENGFSGTLEQYNLIISKVMNSDTLGESGKNGENGLSVTDIKIDSKQINGEISTAFTFKFSDGSVARKRSLPSLKLKRLRELQNTGFMSGLEEIFFVLRVDFDGDKDGDILVSNKECEIENVDFNTPGTYLMKLKYKGLELESNVTIYDSNKADSPYIYPFSNSFVALLDEGESLDSFTIPAYYNGSSQNKCEMVYGEDFFVDHPEILYKNYYKNLEYHSARITIKYYTYSWINGAYQKDKNNYNTRYIYLYDPDNLDVIGYKNVGFSGILDVKKGVSEKEKDFFKDLKGIKKVLSDGSMEDVVFEDSDFTIPTSSYDNPLYNENTVDKATRLSCNLKYYTYYESSYYPKVNTNTYYLPLYVIYLDKTELKDYITLNSNNFSFSSFYITSTDRNLNHNNFNDTNYSLHIFMNEDGTLKLEKYEEVYARVNLNFYVDGNYNSIEVYFDAFELLKHVDYDEFNEMLIESSYNTYKTIEMYYDLFNIGEPLHFTFNSVYLYDDEKETFGVYLKTPYIVCEDKYSYLEDEYAEIYFSINEYFNGREITSHQIERFEMTIGEFEEKYLDGEKFIRNVGGVNLKYPARMEVYFYIPGYELARDWIRLIDLENKSKNNIRDMEMESGIYTLPVGSSLDDLYYDYLMNEETYTSIYSSSTTNYNSYYPMIERSWVKDIETNSSNRVYSTPGLYLVIIDNGFTECDCNSIFLCIEEIEEGEEIGTYSWDIRDDLKRFPSFLLETNCSDITLYSNGIASLALYYLEDDYFDEELGEYIYEKDSYGTFKLPYEFESESIFNLFILGVKYSFEIKGDNTLSFLAPSFDDDECLIKIESSLIHNDYIEINNIYVSKDGFFGYKYDEISLRDNDDDDELDPYWWDDEIKILLIEKCEIISDDLIYLTSLGQYFQIIHVLDTDGNIIDIPLEPDLYYW